MHIFKHKQKFFSQTVSRSGFFSVSGGQRMVENLFLPFIRQSRPVQVYKCTAGNLITINKTSKHGPTIVDLSSPT